MHPRHGPAPLLNGHVSGPSFLSRKKQDHRLNVSFTSPLSSSQSGQLFRFQLPVTSPWPFLHGLHSGNKREVSLVFAAPAMLGLCAVCVPSRQHVTRKLLLVCPVWGAFGMRSPPLLAVGAGRGGHSNAACTSGPCLQQLFESFCLVQCAAHLGCNSPSAAGQHKA